MAINDARQDEKIRAALRSADRNGRLAIIAGMASIAGGQEELRRIMNSKGQLDEEVRSALAPVLR